MKDRKKYGIIINQKFGEFSYPDMDTTWPDMKAILDKEMPRKRKRFLFWFSSFKVIAAVLVISSLSVFLYLHNTNDQQHRASKVSLHEPGTPKNKPAATINATNNLVPEANKDSVSSQPVAGKNPVADNDDETRNSLNTSNPRINTSQPSETLSISHPIEEIITTNRETQPNYQESKRNQFTETEPGNVLDQEPFIYPGRTLLVNIPANLHIEDIRKNLFVNIDEANALKLVPPTDGRSVKKINHLTKIKGWVTGISVNYNLPVSNQEMSTVSIKGERNTLIDFVPSVYLRYHFNEKWHIESAFQFSSPQYTSAHKLASEFKTIDPNKKEENAIWLNKLYYLNVPVSVHFSPLPHLTVGTGIQYSHLRRSLFEEEVASWENGPDGWKKVSSLKNIQVKSNNAVKKDKQNNGNGNGNGNGNNGNGNGGNGNGNGNSGNGNGNGNSGNGNGNGNSGNGNGNGNGGNGNGNGGNGNGNGNGGNGGNGNGGNGNGNGNSGGNSGNPGITAPLTRVDTVAQTLRSSDWRLLFDVNYNWRRINVGCRFNFGLNNYINTRSGNSILPVKDRNQALNFYLRYDIFRKLKKN